MKTKTLLLAVISVLLWSCEQDSSLYSLQENTITSRNGIEGDDSDSNTRSIPKYILYDGFFNQNTGEYFLFYFLNPEYGSPTGLFGSRKGRTPMPNLRPINAEILPTGKIDLHYILDIFITNDNKIIYPPVIVPYFENGNIAIFGNPDADIWKKEQYFSRNQHADMFYNSKKSDFIVLKEKKDDTETADTVKENIVFYTIKGDQMYFHIDPDSPIFSEGVTSVDMGDFSLLKYRAEWTDIIGTFKPIIDYTIKVKLNLIKGNPPVEIPNEEISLACKLYNILVFNQEIYILSSENNLLQYITDENDENVCIYPESRYRINQDETVSILTFNGIEIAKYPSTHNLIKVEDTDINVREEGKVEKIDDILL